MIYFSLVHSHLYHSWFEDGRHRLVRDGRLRDGSDRRFRRGQPRLLPTSMLPDAAERSVSATGAYVRLFGSATVGPAGREKRS